MCDMYRELLLYYFPGSYVHNKALNLVNPNDSSHFLSLESLYLGVVVSTALKSEEKLLLDQI